jgi:decaprenylphospho-beta-D-ribofuranose 2-oxidase
MKARLSGWGRFPVVSAEGSAPRSVAEALDLSPALPRGLGRSYGDASLPAAGHAFADTRFLDRFMRLDPATGVLEAEAGVSLQDILETVLPKGFFLPVTPGTRWVTLGGALASNVHGKNHHHRGSIENFVEWLEVATPAGALRCSRTERPDLFNATVGGYGLTGLITRAALRLKPVASSRILGRGLRRPTLDALFEAFRRNDADEYSVAWIDTLARGASLGRGVLLLGDHAKADPKRPGSPADAARPLLNIPFPAPAGLLQPWALRLFNAAYGWNLLYGARGFFQYQCVIPDPHGERGVEECLRFLTEHGMGSFLAVLKRCGDDRVLLPFCKTGYTLALDIPHRGEETLRRLNALDGIVMKHDGRVYLTKDARLPKETFRAMYPEWSAWMETVRRYNPGGLGRSRLSERLGLWES